MNNTPWIKRLGVLDLRLKNSRLFRSKRTVWKKSLITKISPLVPFKTATAVFYKYLLLIDFYFTPNVSDR